MGLDPELKESVGFLFADASSVRGAKKESIGTCWFLTIWNDARTDGWPFVVTAKHVVKPWADADRTVYIRFNKFTGPGLTFIPIKPSSWFFHKDPAVDLAACLFEDEAPIGDYQCTSLALDQIVATKATLSRFGLQWPPLEAEDVIYVALFRHVDGLDRNSPVVRRGTLAMVPNGKIKGQYGLADYVLIDSRVYPGNSGAPVWVAHLLTPDPRQYTMFLLGIISEGYGEREALLLRKGPRSRQTISYYSHGLTLVVPAEKIVELFSSPEVNEMKKKRTPKLKMPTPMRSGPTPAARLGVTRDQFHDALRRVSRKISPSDQEKKGT